MDGKVQRGAPFNLEPQRPVDDDRAFSFPMSRLAGNAASWIAVLPILPVPAKP